ncbi:MAG TPA: hypothetical protein VNF99_15625 [Stellaceae bacterium]|nr:hypothetical protein [Stellaceae bacterium]
MAQKQRSVEDLLQDLIIVQLALAGVGQHQIRQIAGVDIHRVSRIAKLIKKQKE